MKNKYVFILNFKHLQAFSLVLFLILFSTQQSFAQPANDLCANAIAISCGSSVSGSTATATNDAVAAGCGGLSHFSRSVWYTFVGNGNNVTLSTCGGATWDTQISVFSGSCSTLTCVGANDDDNTGSCGLRSTLTVSTVSGTTYYVLLDGWGSGESGAFTLTMNACASAPPANDLCANALPIACSQTITGTTLGAGIENVANCGGVSLNTTSGVWYTFTGDGSSTTLGLCNSAFDTKIGVFSGTCPALTCTASNNNACGTGGNRSRVTFTSAAGTVYYVLVTGSGGNTGAYTLTRSACASTPTITASGTLSAFSTCTLVASPTQTFTVSGSNLTANLVVTAPTGFEVSLTSSSGFGSSVSLTPSSGSVSVTTIFVRLSASASGSPSGNIVCTSTGATNVNVAANGTVTPNASVASVTGPAAVCIGNIVTYSANSVVLSGGSAAWSSSNTSVATVNSSGVVTAQGAGTCNIIYTITGGCGGTKTAQQSVTVINIVNQSATAVSPICTGNSSTVTVGSTQSGVNYTLRDNSNNAVIAGPTAGTGSAITFNTGTLTSTKVYNVLAEVPIYTEKGVTLPASNDHIRLNSPYYTYSNEITIEAWVNSTGGELPWAGQSTSSADNMSTNVWLWHAGTWYVNDNGNWRALTFPAISSGWTHVATVANASGLSIYYNGVLVASNGSAITSGIRNNSSSIIDLGQDPRYPVGTGGRNSNTGFDHFRVWNTARTVAEISASMNACLIGAESGLVQYTVFNEGTGSSLASLAGSAGTIVNPTTNWIPGVAVCGPSSCTLQMSNTPTVTVNSYLPVSTSLAASATTICATTNVSFTVTPTNGGSSPVYQWYVNGTPVGSNSANYSNSTLNNNDAVWCIMTSNASNCLTGSPAASNTVSISVNPLVPAAVVVAASATTICQETMVTFTATPTNGGSSPGYQWKLNGNNVGTNSPFYSNFFLNHNDVVYCVMTSNSAAICLSSNPATSNLITMWVNPLLPASATISSSATAICPATTVTFSVLPGNPGPSPAFQWQVNGSNVGLNSQTYVTSTLNDQDKVTCVMTSNASPCLTGSPVTSNTITMTVNINLSPSVAVAASPSTICPGENVTFTATPSDAGASSNYQWYLNGGPVGSNSQTYTSSSLSNGDQVYCEFTTSPTPCMTGTFAISNTVTMTVNPNLPASVIISPSAASICPSGSITFTATPTNPGTSPAYQWKVNGNPVGFNNPIFTTTSLNNTDAVVCILTSNAICVTGSPATSNTINMVVDPILPVSISIAASATTICKGAAFFNATPTNGGASPAYQWLVNGNPDGTNSSTFITSTLNNNDVVSCVLTSNVACPSGSPATSNSIVMTVNPILTAAVSISASVSTVCSGSAVTFTPAPVYGGSSPGYIWYVNGVNSGSGPVFITNSLANNDAVSCTMFSNAGPCLTGSPAASNTVTTTVLALPTVNANASATTVCVGTSVTLSGSGTAVSYAWSGGVTNGIGFVPTSTVTYTVTGTGSNSCTKNASIQVKVNQLPNVIANSSSPAVCTGKPVTLTGGGASTYTWSSGVTNGIGFVPTSTSTYTVTGTDANTCMNTATVSVTMNPLPAVIANATATTLCAGNTLKLNGSGADTYVWTGGIADGVSFVPTSSSSYTVTGTDVNGCSNTNSISITVNPMPVVNAGSDVSLCIGDNTTINGSGNGSFSWAPSTGLSCTTCPNPVAAPGSTETYTLTVNNSCGVVEDYVTVSITLLPSVNAGLDVSICTGASASLFASGSGTYTWSSPSATLSCTNCAGPVANPTTTTTYTVSITASCGTATDEVVVAVNSLPTIGINASATTVCAGDAVVLGGTGTSTSYSWSGGIYDQVSFVPGSTDSYTVTGTDANGCVNMATISVNVNSLPTVNANTSASTVCAGTSVTLTGSGTATSYSWDNGVIDGVGFTPSSSLIYVVTGSDANSCTNTAMISVFVNSLPTVNANTSASTVCAGTSITLTGSGTVATYAWSNGAIDGIGIVPTGNTAYVVTGTDANNCTSTATVAVTVNSLPTVNANTTASTVCAGTSVTLSGSGSATSYSWSGGVLNGVGFVPTSSTSYVVTGTNANSCTNTASVLITVNALPVVFANTTANTVCAGTSVTLTGSGTATSYAWSHGAANGIGFVPTASVTYTVTGTGSNSCVNTATVSMTVNSNPTVVAIASSNPVCIGSAVTLNGGGASSYSWSGGIANGVGFTPLTTNTYVVTGTGANGCIGTATVTLTVNPVPAMALNVVGTVITSQQNGATYQWLDCNNAMAPISGATAQSYTASANGNYAVVVNLNGCIDTSACVAITSITTSTSGVEFYNGISVYPNPSLGTFTVQSNSEGVYSIIDELGKTVHSFRLNSANGYKVNVESLGNGIYFIIGYNNDQMTRQKIVIIR